MIVLECKQWNSHRNGVGQITCLLDHTFWVQYNWFFGTIVLLFIYTAPFDFLCLTSLWVVFSLSSILCQTSSLPIDNRSGLLSKEEYSLVLGICRKCMNSNLVLLISFVLTEAVLAFLFLICKLTVASYSNRNTQWPSVLCQCCTIFLPVESTGALSVFLAWLNLDFEIRHCQLINSALR